MQYDLPRCLCVIYLVTSGVAEANFGFLNVAHEISRKYNVVNLALLDSYFFAKIQDGNFQNRLNDAISITKALLASSFHFMFTNPVLFPFISSLSICS